LSCEKKQNAHEVIDSIASSLIKLVT